MTRFNYSNYEFLKISVTDGIAVALNNAPDRRNATTATAHREMAYLYRDLDRDSEVRAVVLGAKGKHFSSGPDEEFVHGLLAGDREDDIRREAKAIVHDAIGFEKPVVSAINGLAMGAALTYCLLADVVVAERDCVFYDAHVRAALVAGDGGCLTFPLYMGVLRAKRYLMTGDPLSAAEAYEFGLVSEVVDRGQALTRAMQFARRFADGPQAAIRGTKASLNQYLRIAATAVYEVSLALELASVTSPDAREAWPAILSGSPGAMPSDPA